jgi:hypothetical protein
MRHPMQPQGSNSLIFAGQVSAACERQEAFTPEMKKDKAYALSFLCAMYLFRITWRL